MVLHGPPHALRQEIPAGGGVEAAEKLTFERVLQIVDVVEIALEIRIQAAPGARHVEVDSDEGQGLRLRTVCGTQDVVRLANARVHGQLSYVVCCSTQGQQAAGRGATDQRTAGSRL